jgi:protein ImuB
VDRWACVSIAALPLQLLVRQARGLRDLPTVVVSEDKPTGKLLWANEPALRAGALPGHSYAVALSLVPGLRAGVVSLRDIAAATDEVKTVLWGFSPRIEVGEEPGVYWLDASGLGLLYVTLEDWALELRARLLDLGFSASVVVGFSRFGTYALARASRDQRVLVNEAEERSTVANVPLVCLDIEPQFRDVLLKLGVRTIKALLQLPAAGLLTRFGETAARLHRLAAGELWSPLEPQAFIAPLYERALLDDAERDSTRLLFVIKRLLDLVLAKLALRGEALASLTLSCKLDRKQGMFGPDQLRPAVPTLDVVQLMDLVRLRIETWTLSVGIVEIELDATGLPTTSEQLRVFAEQPRRDLAAGNRALSRLRAELGEQAVVRAVLCDGQLPEASFSWQPMAELSLPRPMPPSAAVYELAPTADPPEKPEEISAATASLQRRPLVRRIFKKAEVLAAPNRELRNDGWLIRGADHGPVTHSAGPYVVSGGWWMREVHREYSFVLTRRGELLWVYQDKRRRRLYLHGEYE